MKEAYAVRRTVPPSAEIEDQIEKLLAVGVSENPRESLSELARLGARLIIQRAVEDEFDAWLGHARYERPSASGRDLERRARRCGTGFARARWTPSRVSFRSISRRPALRPNRSCPSCFSCSTKVLRTEPLRAMVIGAFVRGLSMRDIEALCAEAGLGSLEGDRVADVSGAARALRALRPPRPLRRAGRGAVPRRRVLARAQPPRSCARLRG